MTDGTFATSDGGDLAGDEARAAIASIATEINDIQLGTGLMGPQPFGVSDGGDLAVTGTQDGNILSGGGDLVVVGVQVVADLDLITGGDTAVSVAGRKAAHGRLTLHGGGALAGTGARVTAFAMPLSRLLVHAQGLSLGTAPEPTPAPLLASLADDTLPVSPGSIIAYVVNGTPDGSCLFSVTGIGELLTLAFDDTGSIGGVSIPVDVPADDSYDLVVTDLTNNLTATIAFTVVAVTQAVVIGAPVTTPPANVQPGVGVKKWVFQDPATSEVYHFAINPSQMNTPFAPKKIQFAATTAIDGNKIAFEGQAAPADWQFNGVLFTQAQYDALTYWSRKRNRIWITDHFSRAFLCYITQYQPVPRRDTSHYWAHDWTMNVLIFEGPVAPV